MNNLRKTSVGLAYYNQEAAEGEFSNRTATFGCFCYEFVSFNDFATAAVYLIIIIIISSSSSSSVDADSNSSVVAASAAAQLSA
jgi:hypothetical protein